ncbi:hypothetical protein VE03_09983 [Pseudogymnoascus sp. 23342-1-I1]|nr:hypothetical protein VE03_09983 [Pseudogymnoascus sp. 23342-1-I1]
MRPPAAAASSARSPAPLRRREKSPVKREEYAASVSRGRASGESAYPYEYPSSRTRPSWRTEREEEEEEEDDGFDEEEGEDLYGLEPEVRERAPRERESRQGRQLDRESVEPEAIELDDDLDEDVDDDNFSAYAYIKTTRSGTWREALTPSFRDIGSAAGRESCSPPAEGKGKGRYGGMAQMVPLASISSSTSMSVATTMPRTRRVPYSYPLRRSDSPPPEPAPMDQVIQADEPWSDTYEVFYLTPLPPLDTTTYLPSDLPAPKRRTDHYVKKGIVIPAHTTAILIAESAGTSPTTATTNTAAAGTTANPSTTTTSTSTSTTTSTTTTQTHTTTHTPPTALTPAPIPPDDDEDFDEGFSEPTTHEATAAMERERERDLIRCISRGGRAAVLRSMGMTMGMGEGGVDGGRGVGGVGVVRPRVRKRISKRKAARREGGAGG